ncbi:MAG TPA: V-type ATP synthase subunit E family protein [Myxococcales bacterium]|nr:V-type ATP synthase subunit E family protein [Myxococcales bacterium]
MKPQGSAAAVLAMMRDDATFEVDRIERDAAAAAARIAGEEPAVPGVAADREVRLAAAARERRDRLARAQGEDRRASLDLREAWMRKVVAEGRKLLEDPEPRAERRAVLSALVREALERLPPGERVVSVCAADADLLDAGILAGATAGPASPIRGGCIARCGNLTVDNSFDERERRLEPQWRAALARMYGP